MKYNLVDILYIDKKFFLNLLKKLTLIIIIINFIYYFNNITSCYLVGLVNITINFSLILISTMTCKFSDNKLCIYSSIYFIIVGILKIFIYILAICYLEGKGFNNRYIIDFLTLIEALFCLFISIYLKDESKEKDIFKYFTINIFLGVLVLFLRINIAINILVILILCLSLWNLRTEKFIKGNYVNIMKIYYITFIIIQVFSLVISYNYLGNYIILNLVILKFISYVILYYWLMQNLISKPYNPLFKEAYKRNYDLKELNKKLRNRNRILEQCQKEDKNKKEYIRQLFDNIPLPIVIISSYNYRIIYGNKTLFQIFKKNPRLIVNKKINNLLPIANIDEFLKEKRWEGMVNIEDKELILNVEIFASQEGDYVLLLKDVTELKRKAKRKDEFDKKRLEEGIKNEFLSNISHDLKTPINVIYTACQLQSSFLEYGNIENIKKYNNVNKGNCMTLTRLANNLIDSSKLSYDYLKPQCSVYNIVELVEETANSLVEYIRDKDLGFEFDTEEEEIWVRCDKEFIERIVINLMSNAIKHTSSGDIKVCIFVNKFKVRIEFIDTGEGMDKDFIKRAFEKYSIEKISKGYRNKSTGIGLYVVKNLVELQGGEIYIESEKEKGTSVKLEFFREKVNA